MRDSRKSQKSIATKPHKSTKSSGHKEDKVKARYYANARFKIDMDLQIYCSYTQYKERAAKNIEKWATRLQALMKSQLLNPMDRISNNALLTILKFACDKNKALKGAEMWLYPFLRSKIADPVLPAHPSLESTSLYDNVKEGLLTSYVQAVNLLFETYSTSDIFAEADTETVLFTQETNMSPLQFANALWIRTLWCPQLYCEYVLRENLWKAHYSQLGMTCAHFGQVISLLRYRNRLTMQRP